MASGARLLLGFLLAGSVVSVTRAADIVNLQATVAQKILVRGDYVAYTVIELFEGTDLNGDTDKFDEVLIVRNLVTGDVDITGLQADSFTFENGLIAFLVLESAQGNQNLNGDADTSDLVLHLWDVETRSVRNTGLAGDSLGTGARAVGIGTELVSFGVREVSQGGSLNGDGDMSDFVLHTIERSTGAVTNRQLAITDNVASGSRLVVAVSEASQASTDLNNDMDAIDHVVHAYNPVGDAMQNLGIPVRAPSLSLDGELLGFSFLESQFGADLNGDSDTADGVALIYDFVSQETLNTGLATFSIGAPVVDGRHMLVGVWESAQGGTDLNGDSDTADVVQHVVSVDTPGIVNLQVSGAAALSNGRIAYQRLEAGEAGVDLNGDGDLQDSVYQTALVSGAGLTGIINVGLPALRSDTFDARLNRRYLVMPVSEDDHGSVDRNDDSDTDDIVLYVLDDLEGQCDEPGGLVQNLELALPDIGVPASGDASFDLDGDRVVFAVGEAEQDSTNLNGDGDASDFVLHVRGDGCECIDCILLTDGEVIFPLAGPGVHEVKIECRNVTTGELLDDTGLRYKFTYEFPDFATTVVVGPQESHTATINFLPGSVLPSWEVTDSTSCDRGAGGSTGECVPPPPLTPNFFVSGAPVVTDDLIATGMQSFQGFTITSGAALDGSSAPALNDGSIYGGGTIADVVGLSGFVPAAGTELVVNLDTAYSPSGYDVSSIDVLSADEADRPQNFQVAVRRVGSSEWVTLHSVTDNVGLECGGGTPPPVPGPDEKEVTFSVGAAEATLAFGTEALRFTFGEPTAYREIDVDGVPSGEVFPQDRFSRGNCNGDEELDLSDAVCALAWLFAGADAPGCIAALNTNGDEGVDLSDPISLLAFLFQGQPAPVAPFPDCGPGQLAADTALGCVDTPPACQ